MRSGVEIGWVFYFKLVSFLRSNENITTDVQFFVCLLL